jgi:isoquinoline 1-oxidoreductase
MITPNTIAEDEIGQIIEPVGYDFGLTRRSFVQVLGAGLLIAATSSVSLGQQQQRGLRGGGGGRRNLAPVPLDARIHLAKDGKITVLTGKVEAGQGARAELTSAAAEELRVAPGVVQLIMADTGLVPDDGMTAGSGTTPRTMPAVRQACAATRNLLRDTAAKKWNVAADKIDVHDGAAIDGDKRFTYADLATAGADDALKQVVPRDVTVTPTAEWKILGHPAARPNQRDIVTGAHTYPADVIRPGMLYGKILRPPGYGATLEDIDLSAAQAMEGVVAVRDGSFVGVAAPSTSIAKKALNAIRATAKWSNPREASSKGLAEALRADAKGGMPTNPFGEEKAEKSTSSKYSIAYAQHAPMEPRAAVAEWEGEKLTVWTSTQGPFRVRGELAGAFHMDEKNVRVIVPDFGGGFGGKHTGETAVEAARLAKAAKKPVALRWTRAEEFTWAYFRPAAAIDCAGSLDSKGLLTSWHFINVNSGGSGLETPYRVEKKHEQYVESKAPLRHGSYRALASTANNFARECFMDELAASINRDPLRFRMMHLDKDGRLAAVLQDAAERFGWAERHAKKNDTVGVGLACGEEKGSFVAACAEVEIDPAKKIIRVRHVTQTFECGAIANPTNLLQQVEGALIMGIGPALREGMEFEQGKILNASFWKYEVPRFKDVPTLDIKLLDRPDLPSSGAGETPIVAIAPAIANAVFHATGQRLRDMPLKLT